MATQYYFIAGTDTGVGKTWFTLQLMRYHQQLGRSVLAYKPIASGREEATGLNEDVRLLQQQMTSSLPSQRLNPYLFDQPIAPNIANLDQSVDLSITGLNTWWHKECAQHQGIDIVLVEGCGGWLLPLNDKETFADWVVSAGMPVLLVVHMRLGCLNHTLLTVSDIAHRGGALVGWIANSMGQSMDAMAENRSFLEKNIQAPLLYDLTVLRDDSIEGMM